jgi:hypothetical protein
VQRFRPIFAIVCLCLLGLAQKVQASTGPGSASAANAATIGNCPVFPPDNPWNRDISNDPVDPNSDAYVATLNSGANKHLIFAFGLMPENGIPYNVVSGTQPKVPITFTRYGNQSDPGPYPVPPNALVEGAGKVVSDKHVIVVDKDNCMLYEMHDASFNGIGWSAASGAVFNLRSNQMRPDGWTSADAAGLPIFPGLVRRDEVLTGAITHALRFTAGIGMTGKFYRYPARHYQSSNTNPNLVQMGMRFRLKASFDISGYPGSAKIILQALKKYGMMIADEGTNAWGLRGMSDPGWDRSNLETLKTVPGSAFEVVAPNYSSPMPPTKTLVPTATKIPPTKTNTPVPPSPTKTLAATATRTPALPSATSAPSGVIKVQYRTPNVNLSVNQAQPYFNIVNGSSSSIPLSGLKIRYYFTRDTAQSLTFGCAWAAVGCGSVTGRFVQLGGSVTGADYYLEVGFTGGSIAAKNQSGDIQVRFNKSDWSTLNQSNDYSFDRARTTWADWTKVAVYRNGTLIWGTNPGGTSTSPTSTPIARTNTPLPTVSSTLRLQYKSPNRVLSTDYLQPHFNVVNRSSGSIALSQVKIRYYFTRDTAQYVIFQCDWAAVGCGNVTGKFVQLGSGTAGADFYLEVGFTTGAGAVAANGQTGDIQVRIRKTDWSKFNQSGDYSFDPTKASYADWTKVTLHRNGSLVWGTPPSSTAPTFVPAG